MVAGGRKDRGTGGAGGEGKGLWEELEGRRELEKGMSRNGGN